MENHNIKHWLNSGQYRSDIDQALTNIIRNVEQSISESQTSTIFENELYYLIRTKTDVNISIKKEQPIDGIVHSFSGLNNRNSGHGRLDAVVNSLIIEYKHHSKLETTAQIRKAYEQVKDYLVAIFNAEGIKYDAILTDGLKIAYFQFAGNEVRHTNLRLISVDDIDIVIRAILNNNTKKFEPKNIVKDFSISPFSASDSKEIANILFRQLCDSSTAKTSMLFEEWKSLMHLSIDDNGKSSDIAKRRRDLSDIFSTVINDTEGEYRALFALQTTYAIIVKLIACKVVDNLEFNSETNEYHDLVSLSSSKIQEFFRRMEDGYSYSSMGIRNFLEGDFFSWYADAEQWSSDFYTHIKKLIITVDEYSSFNLNVSYSPIDVFKDLYISIIPQSIRHSMGEYFTPEWLADCVISSALKLIPNKNNWSAIDPCCGSGIFIISLIKKIVGNNPINELSNSERKQLLSNILERVHGIDINPLSVLSARVSYYIALRALGIVENIEIPIYLGDSAIIPTSKVMDGIECYFYSVNNLKCHSFDVVLPKRFVESSDFGLIMSQMQAIVKAEQVDTLNAVICSKLTEKEKESAELLRNIYKLCETLVYLHKNKWDGIWIRIATNFMLIARLAKFDLIVGNPPWVKWEHLPQAYTEKIKEFCDIRHIFCNDGMYGGAQLNICALISNVTASNWLKNDGILAFLMPDSIMSQNSYEEFRNFYIDYEKNHRLFLQTLDRWIAPLRPFKCGTKSVSQDFNTYFFGFKEIDYSAGVPIRVIGKQKRINDLLINGCSSYEEASQYLVISDAKARQLAPNSTAFTYCSDDFDFSSIIGTTAYNYRTGVESTPFEIFKMLGVGPSEKPGHYRFKNKILKASKYKVTDIPIHGWDFPTRLIYPMVEGPSLKPFGYNIGNNYHIVPYEESRTSSPISLEELLLSDNELAIYFANHRSLLDMQSDKSKTMHQGSEFYALSKIGPYTFAPYMVAARDNTYFCASVIRPTITPWGETKTSLCVKHTIIISQDINGNFITEDESHFINGILNSSIVHSYIHSTFKTNGFSLKKSNLFIPKFDAQNSLHMAIVDLSKEATQHENKRSEIIDLLSEKYLEICRTQNH